jgi:hypothetical protein
MTMINTVDVDTRWGYRSFELWNADITNLGFAIDLLIISAVGSGLWPMDGTVIGALSSRLAISNEQLREEREFDFIQPLNLWGSSKIASMQIHRIMCVHIPPGETNITQMVEQAVLVLPILEARGSDGPARRLSAGKQPTFLQGYSRIATRRTHPPPLSQQPEHLVRQHHIAIFAALRLLDANDLLCPVDMLDLEPHDLARPHYGLLAKANRAANIARARELLAAPSPSKDPKPAGRAGSRRRRSYRWRRGHSVRGIHRDPSRDSPPPGTIMCTLRVMDERGAPAVQDWDKADAIPDTATLEDIRRFQLHLAETGVSICTRNRIRCATASQRHRAARPEH